MEWYGERVGSRDRIRRMAVGMEFSRAESLPLFRGLGLFLLGPLNNLELCIKYIGSWMYRY